MKQAVKQPQEAASPLPCGCVYVPESTAALGHLPDSQGGVPERPAQGSPQGAGAAWRGCKGGCVRIQPWPCHWPQRAPLQTRAAKVWP